eukprot:symbB.v1.2.038885.t1/scaffold6222.1/size19942/3
MPVSYMPVMLSHAPVAMLDMDVAMLDMDEEECNSDAVWQTRHHPKLLFPVAMFAYAVCAGAFCTKGRQAACQRHSEAAL